MNPLYRNDRPGQFPKSWYTATTRIPDERPALFGETAADVCVIGAGYTGLSAALHLARKGYSVVVLEAHRAGFGASGRNGGQVGTGFNRGQIWLDKKMGGAPARALWDMAQEAVGMVRDFCATEAPEARFLPGVAHGAWTAAEVEDEARHADFLQKTYGYDQIDFLDKPAMQALVRSPIYQGGVLDRGAGHVHPLRYAIGLARAAEAAGAVIHERSEAQAISRPERAGDKIRVKTPQGQVVASHVIMAGNGYMPTIEPKVAAKVMPFNSFMAATAPLDDAARQVLTRDIAVADSRFVVNYFRMSEDNRLLFGGRESYGIDFPKDIKTALVQRMVHLFPQLEGVGIDYVWGGTLAITVSRLPSVMRVGPNILSAAGFSGHGVALSGFAGRVMAEAIAGQAERFDLMSRMPTPGFPGGTLLRSPLMVLAMTWYSLRDRLGI